MSRSPLLAVAAIWLLALLTSCGAPTTSDNSTTPSDSAARAFAAPQGVAVHRRWIVVANTSFEQRAGKRLWGAGFVTLIDRPSRRVVRRIPTSQPNPAAVAISGDAAYIVNSGTFALDEQGLATVTSGGGVDVLQLDGETPPSAMSDNIPLPRNDADRRIGGYGSIAISPDGRWAYLGSGTRADLFQIDLLARTTRRGPTDPIEVVSTPAGQNGLTTARRLGDKLAVLDFNSDSLCIGSDWDNALSDRKCHSIGINAELLEGPIDLAARDADNALVLMSIANSIYGVGLGDSTPAIDYDLASTGLACNRVVVRGDFAYVVNSASNNIERVDLRDGSWSLPFSVFAEHANPFDLAVSEEDGRDVAWVTLFGANALAVVDLQDGALLQTIGPDADVPMSSGDETPATTCPATDSEVVGISHVVSVNYGPGAGQGQDQMPATVRGAPHGAGAGAGAAEGVLSLGKGGEIIVDFGDRVIVDGPGPDFIVFENAFTSAPYEPFAEPAIVAVSSQGSAENDFYAYPCDLKRSAGDPIRQLWPYPGCAGVHPVLAPGPSGCVDATDPEAAGGDAYDLADLGLRQARLVRVRDAGISSPASPTAGFDLDAIVLIHYASAGH